MGSIPIDIHLSHTLFTANTTGNSGHGISRCVFRHQLAKDDILKLIQRALDDDKFEMDPYDDTLVQNAAHKVIYKNIYQKLDDLLKHRISFNDERTGLYRTAINAYSHDQNHEV